MAAASYEGGGSAGGASAKLTLFLSSDICAELVLWERLYASLKESYLRCAIILAGAES